jgi:UDP-N-acetylmuramate dehydrogenase
MNKDNQNYILENYPNISFANEMMKKHSTFGVGGPAKILLLPKKEIEVKSILKYCSKMNIKTCFIGSGSNLLFSDKGFNGLIISLKKAFKGLEVLSDGSIKVGSGVMLVKMVSKAIKNNIKGLESLSGVPGTLGGALYMNAGAYGSEISNFFTSARLLNLNGDEIILTKKDISFSYRKSTFPRNHILVEASFKCEKGNLDNILKNKNKFSQSRRENQPLKYRSAGSIFKNPSQEVAAGYLIDQSGLKGIKKGDAMISDKHANFIVNLGNASSEDIVYLIKLIKKKVVKKFNIDLELEIKLLGFNKNVLKGSV